MISNSGDKLSVQGPITFTNVEEVIEQGINLFDKTELVVDLKQVTEVDSSAVSVLLEWQRTARKNNQRLFFTNIPENLKNLTQLYGVTELVPLV